MSTLNIKCLFGGKNYKGQHVRFWYVSHWRAANAQMSLTKALAANIHQLWKLIVGANLDL